MAQWLSWLERRPVTAEVESSSLFWVVYRRWSVCEWGLSSAGSASALQAEGHRFEPYRPHFVWENILIHLLSRCRSGGTGRRTGLKILRGLNFVPVRFRSAAVIKNERSVEFVAFLFFFCFKRFEYLWTFYGKIPGFWNNSLALWRILIASSDRNCLRKPWEAFPFIWLTTFTSLLEKVKSSCSVRSQVACLCR